MRQLTIDPEFRDKVPPMTQEEFQQLEENIVKAGRVLVPLVVWGNTIVDGHNRWAIIEKHPEIEYQIEQIEFKDRYEAIVWICKNQLGRRNLTEAQKSYLRGKQYEAEKMTQGTNNQYVQAKNENGQNVHFQSRREIKDGTAGRIGKEYGVNGRTIRRDAEFAKGIDMAEKTAPGIRDAILSGEVKVSKETVAQLPSMPKETRSATIQSIASGDPPKKKSNNPAGYSKERRELDKTIENVVSAMCDTDRAVEHTVDDLIEDITAIIDDFTKKIKRSLQNHSTVLQDQSARERAIAALSEAEAAISKMKGIIL